MEIAELLEIFRLETDDLAEPYLWSDKEFFVYLNDAQDTFVRRIGGIADSSSPLTKVTYKVGDTLLKYDPRILRIKAARDDRNNKLTVFNIDNFEDSATGGDDYGYRVNAGLEDGVTSDVVRYLITDIEEDKFRLYPTPSLAGYVRLIVDRRPLDQIVDTDSVLEIQEQHHLALLYWVRYKAYLKQDVETMDAAKATEMLEAFEVYVARARREKSNREDRKRTIRYGGIPM